MAADKGRIVLVGRTGAGKSTLVNMLVKGNLTPPHLAKMGNGLHGTTKICQTFDGRGWTVIDTMGLGEPDTGSVSNPDAKKLVSDFLNDVKGKYSHIIFVIEKGRIDIVTGIIWKTFLQIFKGGETNFVVLFTKTGGAKWLQENLEQIKTEFPECKQFQYVDFPEIDDDPEVEKENSEIRMTERDRLESELTRMFAGSWVEPDIFRMGDVEIEQKAENILVYIAKLIKSLLLKHGMKALQTTVTIFVAIAELVNVFAGGF
ncbi:unnamed protein product [Sphagnum jensenii]|uniref:G domain-containing protein n=1 Tax=Sphagnum jensenii TaxID=128206 RepID=A0ABP0WPG0_9BRYO